MSLHEAWQRIGWIDGPPRGEVDAFFAEYVADVFATFGYRRHGAHWTKVSPNGDTSSVWFQRTTRSYAAAFYVEPGFWTALVEETERRRGYRGKLTASEGLFHDRVLFAKTPLSLFPDEWVYGDAASREIAGAELRTVLERDVLPWMDRLRNRRDALEEVSQWDDQTALRHGLWRSKEIAMAYLFVDVADVGSERERSRAEEIIEATAAVRGDDDPEVQLFREVWQRRLKGE